MSTTPDRDRTWQAIDGLVAAVVRESAYDGEWIENDRHWRNVRVPRKDPSDWTDNEYKDARENSRLVCKYNGYAVAGLKARRNYVVRTGFTHAYRPVNGVEETAPVVVAAKDWLDHLTEVNDMPAVEAESLRRGDEDGEYIVRVFPAGGVAEFRFVEPASLFTPPEKANDPAVRFGIEFAVRQTERGPKPDYQTPVAYWIDGERVPAAEVVHVKFNVRSSDPRGIPTFLPVTEFLFQSIDLLRSMSATAKARAKIALLWKLASLTKRAEDGLKNRLKEGTQHDARGNPIPASVEQLPFGAVIRYGKDDELEFPSSNIGASDSVAVLQAVLRLVSVVLQQPEWMLTGLADQKYSNAFVVEAPTFAEFESLQQTIRRSHGEGRVRNNASLIWRALRIAVAHQLVPAEAMAAGRIVSTPPHLEVRDKAQEATTNKTYLETGVKSIPTVQKELGLDPELEAKQGAAQPGAAALLQTVGGTQNLVQLQQTYAAGGLPRNMAVAVAVEVFGLTPPQANRLFPELAPDDVPNPGAGTPAALPGAPVAESKRPGGTLTIDDVLAEVRALGDVVREARDLSKLVKKKITDVNGVQRTVYVKPGGEDPGKADGAVAPGDKPPAVDYKHKDENHPAVKAMKADPELNKKVADYHEKAKAAAAPKAEADRLQVESNKAWKAVEAERLKETSDPAEIDRLTREAGQASVKYSEAVRARDAAKAKSREEFAEAFAAPDPTEVNSAPLAVATSWTQTPDGPPSKLQQESMDQATGWVGRVLGGGRTLPVKWGKVKGGRAHCEDFGTAAQVIGTGTDFESVKGDKDWMKDAGLVHKAAKVNVHELGHAIEHTDPEVKRKCKEFLDYRVGDEKEVPLKEVAPTAGYSAAEKGRKDNFDRVFGDEANAYYAGKEYPGRGTEILSMGLEKMYDDPADFAAKDPEYFHFIVSVLGRKKA